MKINLGSSDEYGDNLSPQVETFKDKPFTPYSFAKSASSLFLEMLYKNESFPCCTLRIFLTYGPHQDVNRFIPQIIIGCLKNESFPVSKGEQLRDFCFIDDVVEAIFLVFASSKSSGEIINIASGKPVSVRDVVEKIQNITKGGYPKFGEIEYRSNENMSLYADINKAKKFLNWNPKYSLEEGLKFTIDWFYENEK